MVGVEQGFCLRRSSFYSRIDNFVDSYMSTLPSRCKTRYPTQTQSDVHQRHSVVMSFTVYNYLL